MTANELREYARVLRSWLSTPEFEMHPLDDALLAAADLLDREARQIEAQYTHSAECWKSGKMHYECAVQRIEELQKDWSKYQILDIEAICKQRDDLIAEKDALVAEVRRLTSVKHPNTASGVTVYLTSIGS